ncbi:hypothetical protein RRG08_001863 [Elysia crispata]|uniref:Uncharacterized protein n=1 Tax=Elysia crispata TaxID=231223 RepID=A0AAE1A4C9_9GAST|nr:hypothetical protein RRG08_001863 [Elysia crispata]
MLVPTEVYCTRWFTAPLHPENVGSNLGYIAQGGLELHLTLSILVPTWEYLGSNLGYIAQGGLELHLTLRMLVPTEVYCTRWFRSSLDHRSILPRVSWFQPGSILVPTWGILHKVVYSSTSPRVSWFQPGVYCTRWFRAPSHPECLGSNLRYIAQGGLQLHLTLSVLVPTWGILHKVVYSSISPRVSWFQPGVYCTRWFTAPPHPENVGSNLGYIAQGGLQLHLTQSILVPTWGILHKVV